MEFYRMSLETASTRVKSQLGLGRICVEAQMALSYAVIDGQVEITAETRIGSHDV
jgi:hypothetical protein